MPCYVQIDEGTMHRPICKMYDIEVHIFIMKIALKYARFSGLGLVYATVFIMPLNNNNNNNIFIFNNILN